MNKSTITNSLILLPLYWLFSGMLIMGGGDKPMVAMVIISIVATVLTYGSKTLKENLRSDKVLWVLLAITLYAIFSYLYHGLSSREIRGVLTATLLLTVLPRHLITSKILLILILLGSISSLGTAYYNGIYLDLPRGAWPINAIPQATLSAIIALLAFCLSQKFTGKMRGVALLSFMLGTIAVVLSQTRGIWLAYSCTLLILIFLHARHLVLNKKVILISIAAIFSTGFLFKPIIEHRVKQTQYELNKITSGNLNTSIGLRLQMWKISSKIVADNWVLGTGDEHKARFDLLAEQGEVSAYFVKHRPPHYHNQYIDRYIKNGVVGLALLLALLITPIVITKGRSSSVNSLCLVITIASLTDTPLNHAQTILMFTVLITLLTSITISTKNYD
ncbi:O-antigen ligase family protein [Photobacterium minamisatsumaniensis]|uniref:O-antigen ligase family protein n=1 Tax=Photobacterium minamisatsumaniensis TaxID=2910233 RepID=UPI003D0F193B